MDASWISALSDVGNTLIAGIVAGFVWIEYQQHKRTRRAELALSLASAVDADELEDFAVTSLDWGAGIVAVPQRWQHLFSGKPPTYSAADVEDALLSQLTE